MNLLYIWNEAYFGANENEGCQLSARYQITFDRTALKLSVRRKKDIFSGSFWGENIYDAMAVVGRNGAGKTRLAYSIMETLEEASRLADVNFSSQQSRFAFILVFADSAGAEEKIKIFTTYPNLNVGIDSPLRDDFPGRWDDLKRFKFAYFTDSLSFTDYSRKKYGIVHDGSLGGAIRDAFQSNREMHYIDGAMSPITNYFNDEMGKILDFVCFDRNQEGIPFALPERVKFSVQDYNVNLDYISEQLDEMKITDGGDILKKKCNEIRSRYGQNMGSLLAIHLLLNLFKSFCIPQTSLDHLEERAQVFLDIISRMECSGEDAFGTVLKLLEQIKPVSGDSERIDVYQKALEWLRKQPALQTQRSWAEWSLNLTKERETIKGLYDHYRKTNFPFPYFSISFGLSTGEYAFLRRFVRINELLRKGSDGRSYVTNNICSEKQCDGLMIYLDEADQSMHPEWQRKQMDWLLKFLSARFETCSTQLVVATHSPIMLSDFPRSHVLYLGNSGQGFKIEKRKTRIFGNNIHTLFRDAFFLDGGTMGAFAEQKINEIAQSLQDTDGSSPDMLEIVEEVGDDVIRNKLRQMSRVKTPKESRPMDRQTVEGTIRLLHSQKERLEGAIRELENMRHD